MYLIVLVIFLLLFLYVNKTETFNQKLIGCEDTIFVSIASYRDKLCSQTINSLFSKAKYPEKITVGICQQNDSTDIECEEQMIDFKWKQNIKIIRIPHIDAKGPTWARYLCSTLWKNEKYYLQIDSHTLFKKDWDIKCINMIKELKQNGIKKPLISHYPKIHTDIEHQDVNKDIPIICKSFFNDRKMISFLGAENISIEQSRFKPTPYIAAGMFFVESTFLKHVPYDPNLPYLFVGEEILHSIRFWTHGYDIFTPSENIIFHYYTRSNEPKIWTDKTYTDENALNKVKTLLGIHKLPIVPDLNHNMEKYGLGNIRTIKDYFDFAGIDLNTQSVSRDFCKDDILPIFNKYKL